MEDTWLTKAEVTQLTGWAERTIDRRATEGAITKQHRAIPGRKSVPIYSKADVEKVLHEQQTLRPTILKTQERKPTRDVSKSEKNGALVKSPPRHLAAMSSTLNGGRLALYLTLDEAVSFTGLPKSVLQQDIADGILPARKAGAYYIRRSHLRHYDAATRKLDPEE